MRRRWSTPFPPVRHTVMQMRYGWRRLLILSLNSYPCAYFCFTDLLSAPRHTTDFSKLDRDREREWDGHSLRCLISVQGACTKREMNMFAFDTADLQTAAVLLRVCVVSPVCCVIHHIGIRWQANDVTQSDETTCSGKRCLNCQRELLITFAKGCDSLQRDTEARHANVSPLLWLYTGISVCVNGLCSTGWSLYGRVGLLL